MLHIAVFASGRGSNFEALQQAITKNRLDARIVVVISNNSQAGALALAQLFRIPTLHFSQKQYPSAEAFNEALLAALEKFKVDLIVLAGYMKKLDPVLIGRFRNRIINIHPALLPKFGGAGMYGMHVHEAVLAAKEKKSGATVHIVNEEYDRGPILLQQEVEIAENETPESLAAKVLKVEHLLLPRAVAMFAEKKIVVSNNSISIQS